jgi:hypothetical protein
VTDNLGAIGVVSQSVTVSTGSNVSSKLFATVAEIGARPQNGHRLTDELADGSPNLSTAWNNDGNNSTAWFTLDLGDERQINDVKLGPRADRNYTLDIYIGSTLSSGQVSGAPVATCTPATGATDIPTDVQSCTFQATSGRYVTVKRSNGSWLKFYGVEVWGY